MSKLAAPLGKGLDLPQLEGINLNAASGTGSGGDYEHVITVVPNLGQIVTQTGLGLQSALYKNAMKVREAYLVFEAGLTGANTNNVTFNINQRRGGSFLVNTTSATTISAGTQTVTPVSMANITINTQLVFSGGTGAAETVTVSAVTPTTFTATFANGHSGAYTIVSAPLATATFNLGTNATAYAPFFMKIAQANILLPGDVVTVQRVTAGTGLATPAVTIVIDWINAGVAN